MKMKNKTEDLKQNKVIKKELFRKIFKKMMPLGASLFIINSCGEYQEKGWNGVGYAERQKNKPSNYDSTHTQRVALEKIGFKEYEVIGKDEIIIGKDTLRLLLEIKTDLFSGTQTPALEIRTPEGKKIIQINIGDIIIVNGETWQIKDFETIQGKKFAVLEILNSTTDTYRILNPYHVVVIGQNSLKVYIADYGKDGKITSYTRKIYLKDIFIGINNFNLVNLVNLVNQNDSTKNKWFPPTTVHKLDGKECTLPHQNISKDTIISVSLTTKYMKNGELKEEKYNLDLKTMEEKQIKIFAGNQEMKLSIKTIEVAGGKVYYLSVNDGNKEWSFLLKPGVENITQIGNVVLKIKVN
jgi:hypothetical protein